ncbi:hypothetical protein KQI36_12065 [Clostridium senegalense]|uniref:hypothetical protein n=1 Tax=Clostridium senegalense TaxID=1465809 RepID=UPI001C12826B|nr:hypothetical protein [Clostridium senegalense]MBU5227375.1 hypothetical protein [Clostridium senegalense]
MLVEERQDKNMFNSKKYIKKVNKYMNKLDDENLNVKENIEIVKKNIDLKKQYLKKIEKEVADTELKYKKIKKMLTEKGITFFLEGYLNLEQWDNLFFEKSGEAYNIIDKNKNTIKSLDIEISKIIEELLNENVTYSILVIRRSGNTLVAQIRFTR